MHLQIMGPLWVVKMFECLNISRKNSNNPINSVVLLKH